MDGQATYRVYCRHVPGKTEKKKGLILETHSLYMYNQAHDIRTVPGEQLNAEAIDDKIDDIQKQASSPQIA